MRCQICKENQATIHLTEITDGLRSEMHVCERCAREQGIAVKTQMPINELLTNLLSSQPAEGESSAKGEKELICPHCGFTLDQFRKEALLGCPYDYELFEKVLRPLIEKAQDGKLLHCGKVPSRAPRDTRRQTEMLALRQQLDEAIRREDYELAAKLRDKMSQLQ
jgi:protein arginine kinase activator